MRGELVLQPGQEPKPARTEAQARMAREPKELWINCYQDNRKGFMVTETCFTRLDETYQNILDGYVGLSYRYTIYVSPYPTVCARIASVEHLEDAAQAWASEQDRTPGVIGRSV